jgi:glycosyltransferase involved in cell wall biosynthesis
MLRLRRSWDFALCHQLYLHSAIAAIIARLTRRRSASLLVAAQTYSDIDRLLRLRGGRTLIRLALKTDVVFALSAKSRRELRDAGVPAERVLPYHYFVDPHTFAPSPLGEGAVLISIGRFDPQKNLPLLVRAFELVQREIPNARLRLIGHGPSENDLRRLVAASPARDAVSVESWTDDPAAAYRAARAVVMSSDAEGLSNVLLEAMASGRPVVTTDVSGAREALALDEGLIKPGETRIGRGGILVPLGDANALAGALVEILRNDQLAATLAADARARVVEAFSEEASVQQFLHGVATAERLAEREPRRWD